MPEYLVELYLTGGALAALAELLARVRPAAAAMNDEGRQIALRRSIFIPQDETCFLLFEADSRETVDEANRRASIACLRITEAVTTGVGAS